MQIGSVSRLGGSSRWLGCNPGYHIAHGDADIIIKSRVVRNPDCRGRLAPWRSERGSISKSKPAASHAQRFDKRGYKGRACRIVVANAHRAGKLFDVLYAPRRRAGETASKRVVTDLPKAAWPGLVVDLANVNLAWRARAAARSDDALLVWQKLFFQGGPAEQGEWRGDAHDRTIEIVKNFLLNPATISAPMPPCSTASWTTIMRPVFFTESTMVSISSGEIVRGSMTSTEIPSAANSFAAASAGATMLDRATMVR